MCEIFCISYHLNRSCVLAPTCPEDCSASDCESSTKSLPNARFASSILHTDLDDPEIKVTALLMQWAQFVDHDISLSPEGLSLIHI